LQINLIQASILNNEIIQFPQDLEQSLIIPIPFDKINFNCNVNIHELVISIGARVTELPHPLFFDFLFTYLFSKNVFNISFPFIYRVHVHISIQSYYDKNLHMTAIYTLTIHKSL